MNPWKELLELCDQLPVLQSPHSSPKRLQTALRRMKTLLRSLPSDDISLAAAKAASMYHEAVGDLPAALEASRIYLDRLERLHRELETNDYSPDVRQVLLEGFDANELQRCQMTIQRLEALI